MNKISNEINNPFSPGAGTQPPELAGRSDILDKALLTLARVKNGKAEKSMLLVGLRGVGKTVLLNKISQIATDQNYKVAKIEANEVKSAPQKKSLPELLLPELRRLLFSFSDGGSMVNKAFRVLKSFASRVKVGVKHNDVEYWIDIEPEKGVADSGDLEADLAQVFLALGRVAAERNTAIAIAIDELQYLNVDELSSLIMSAHRVSQESLPIVIFGAGLPQLVGKAGRAKSYAERLFDYPEIGPLKKGDSKLALQIPVQKEGFSFTEEALDEIIRVTKGYPYFIQEWGYHSWNLTNGNIIDIDTVKHATDEAINRLDKNFFRVRFDRLTRREKDYLRALAELGTNSRSGDIAKMLDIHVQSAAPLRNNLIKKGMIYSPDHGDNAFTVPLFDDFMKRTMPNWIPSRTGIISNQEDQ